MIETPGVLNYEEKKLHLDFHGRILEHLGIQMYQSPTASIAELIANAWDADARNVRLSVPTCLDAGSVFIIQDDGDGMTFEDCENRFLKVGYNRRKNEPAQKTETHKRPVMGRKGIGKFAGFGIAKVIEVDTVSNKDRYRTKFQLDLNKLNSDEYLSNRHEIQVELYEPVEDNVPSGTTITLSSLTLKRTPSIDQFSAAISRRFLGRMRLFGFEMYVNGSPIEDNAKPSNTQFEFPKDLDDEKKLSEMRIQDGWAVQTLKSGNQVEWQIFMTKDPLNDEDIRGITVFSNNKLVQKPFFFNLTGGTQGQHGMQYMTGSVVADFLEQQTEDLVAPERQRVRWDTNDETLELQDWGIKLIKNLLKTWADKRSADKIERAGRKMGGLIARINKLSNSEQKQITSAIKTLSKVETLTDDEFQALGNGLLKAFEEGRLKGLVDELQTHRENFSETDLLSLLVEADVLAALNVAESIKVKVAAIKALRTMVDTKQWELQLRDHIAKNPWILSPQWETFKVERNVQLLLDDASKTAKLDTPATGEPDPDYKRKRIDLALRSGNQLLIVEFMRPGATLDFDHMGRLQSYMSIVKSKIKNNTSLGLSADQLKGLVVANNLSRAEGMAERIESVKDTFEVIEWGLLVDRAENEWRDYLSILLDRAPDDRRLHSLVEPPTENLASVQGEAQLQS